MGEMKVGPISVITSILAAAIWSCSSPANPQTPLPSSAKSLRSYLQQSRAMSDRIAKYGADDPTAWKFAISTLGEKDAAAQNAAILILYQIAQSSSKRKIKVLAILEDRAVHDASGDKSTILVGYKTILFDGKQHFLKKTESGYQGEGGFDILAVSRRKMRIIKEARLNDGDRTLLKQQLASNDEGAILELLEILGLASQFPKQDRWWALSQVESRTSIAKGDEKQLWKVVQESILGKKE